MIEGAHVGGQLVGVLVQSCWIDGYGADVDAIGVVVYEVR